jgi:peptidoglycan/xylan/chitin deacetylase (PgdA/CDA1 family)
MFMKLIAERTSRLTIVAATVLLILVLLTSDKPRTAQKAPLAPVGLNLQLSAPTSQISMPVAQSSISVVAPERSMPLQAAPAVNQPQQTSQPATSISTPAPVYYKLSTDQPLVFLGIDDGWTKSPEAQDWLVQRKLPFTLFLTDAAIKDNYGYFKALQQAGMTIEDHTLTHPDLAKLTLDQQKTEICGAADIYQNVYGLRPTLLRPPDGGYNSDTQQAAAACGMKAVIMWHAKANGGSLQFQDGNQHLLPGDIVLMHFRPEFLQDMAAFMKQVQQDNLQIGRLEDYL